MDKYQSYIMKNRKPFLYGKCSSPNGKIDGFSVKIDDDFAVTLCQHEDITFINYMLYIDYKPTVIESVFAIAGDIQSKLKNSDDHTFSLPIDFDNRFDSLKIVFKDDLADDVIIPVVYKEADKKAYYERKEQEKKSERLTTANIKVSTGADLVNIYFQPCCEEYVRAEIILYREGMMIAKYKVEEETFFKSISGLAYGKYEFIMKQYDNNNNLLLETDKLSFSLTCPDYGGKPLIYYN